VKVVKYTYEDKKNVYSPLNFEFVIRKQPIKIFKNVLHRCHVQNSSSTQTASHALRSE
jgi:hypothetical protein